MKAFKTLRTLLGEEIKVRSNTKERTYTIVKNGSTYRTFRMSKEEFNNAEFNTGDDWNYFLRSNDYYKVIK